ncbi:MAG: thioredoxin-dependent thiol peroxidase [Planctomycetes bacterium]|nr:thioredoxin-dependent thiol peroxidase [Planctomycetota bacterium]
MTAESCSRLAVEAAPPPGSDSFERVANPSLEEGKRAPAFTLPSTEGGSFRLTEHRGRWVVAYFYPKDLTPGCTTEAENFRDALASFEDLGALVVGISPDPLERHERFVEKHDLNFPLLVDRDAKVASKYGVWRTKKNYGREYLGIVRSTFLIDPSGKVARLWDNIRVKGHVEKVLAALEEELEA